MVTERNTSKSNVSLPKLVAMFFSPLALRHCLETIPPACDSREVANIRYRNSLFLLTYIDKHINRSAAVVVACFFVHGLFSVLQVGALYLVTYAVMLAAILHAAVLGIYRQVLNERVTKYAKIIDAERPVDRDEPQAFPGPPGDRARPEPTVGGKPLVDRRRTSDRRK